MSAAFGYASLAYAESLAEFGEVIKLPHSGGALLSQTIAGGTERDAAGPYPIFACRDWSGLSADLDALSDRLVCAYAVADPFGEIDAEELARAFPDLCYAYKHHFVADLSSPLDSFVDAHHRRNIRKGLKQVEVRRLPANAETLAAWQSLYACLIERHDIRGIARFSPESFAKQFVVPGFDCFAAVNADGVCGMTLWYVDRGVAYYHLGAYDDQGYARSAAFAIFATAFQQFAAEGVRWAALGAGAGTTAANSGLTRFKQGWSTETRPAYFCGRILQPDVYARLTASASARTKFFPAYRAPR